MTNQVILEAAVEAAAEAAGVVFSEPANARDVEYIRTILDAAAPHMLIHVHHHDIEHHARSFNEGYETCMAQELADDPSLAQDWLDEKLASVWDEGEAAGQDNASAYQVGTAVKSNPYGATK